MIQGGDPAVAVADTFEKLAVHSVNIVAHQAVSTGTGYWGMILWVEPDDYERASEALGF